jgi:hypothetical protein
MRRLLTVAALLSVVSVVHAARPTFRQSMNTCRRLVDRAEPGGLDDVYYYQDGEGTGHASIFGLPRAEFLFVKCMREQGHVITEGNTR